MVEPFFIAALGILAPANVSGVEDILLVVAPTTEGEGDPASLRLARDLQLALDRVQVQQVTIAAPGLNLLPFPEQLALVRRELRARHALAAVWLSHVPEGLVLLHFFVDRDQHSDIKTISASERPGVEMTLALMVRELIDGGYLLALAGGEASWQAIVNAAAGRVIPVSVVPTATWGAALHLAATDLTETGRFAAAATQIEAVRRLGRWRLAAGGGFRLQPSRHIPGGTSFGRALLAHTSLGHSFRLGPVAVEPIATISLGWWAYETRIGNGRRERHDLFDSILSVGVTLRRELGPSLALGVTPHLHGRLHGYDFLRRSDGGATIATPVWTVGLDAQVEWMR